jgi:hypothetical protein
LAGEFVPCPKEDCPKVNATGHGINPVVATALAVAKNTTLDNADEQCGEKCSSGGIIEDNDCVCRPN